MVKKRQNNVWKTYKIGHNIAKFTHCEMLDSSHSSFVSITDAFFLESRQFSDTPDMGIKLLGNFKKTDIFSEKIHRPMFNPNNVSNL